MLRSTAGIKHRLRPGLRGPLSRRPDMQIWWDAMDITNYATNEVIDAVTPVPDKSGKGRPANACTNAATFKNADGGKPLFGNMFGNDTRLTHTAAWQMSTAHTMFFVFRTINPTDGTGSGLRLLFSFGEGINRQIRFHAFNNASAVYTVKKDNGVDAITINLNQNYWLYPTWTVLCLTSNGFQANTQVFRNLVEATYGLKSGVDSGEILSTARVFGLTAQDGTDVGAYVFREVQIYARKMNATQRTRIIAGLMAKWAIA